MARRPSRPRVSSGGCACGDPDTPLGHGPSAARWIVTVDPVDLILPPDAGLRREAPQARLKSVLTLVEPPPPKHG